ncbi:MAG TPA: type I methionyl aminopeptidase [Gemmatales bacterium]|nr:type I methionyl aminopeptidase [Gemmatales bacterium]
MMQKSQQQQQKPILKTAEQIAKMREAGKLVAEALHIARTLAVPGTRTLDIDQAIDALFAKHKAEPLFKGYPGKRPFPASTCICLNEQVVHGIPGPRVLRPGDLLKVDTACKLDGFCADAAICVPIGDTVRPDILKLVKTAEEALALAIREIGKRKRWSEVSIQMQQHVEKAGFSIVERFVGHGIGRSMHEAPQVPNYSNREMREVDFDLVPGLVLAIEPMVNFGKKDVQELPDQWTVITRDRLPSAHVEHTVAITEQGIQILTARS